jgi:hypothetical protein
MNSRLQQHPIAIVGMASIFANSRNLEQYWENITTKLDAIMDVPLSRWNIDDHYSPDKKSPDKTYCRRGGLVCALEKRAHDGEHANAEPRVARSLPGDGDRAEVGQLYDQGSADRGRSRRTHGVVDGQIVESCAKNGVG